MSVTVPPLAPVVAEVEVVRAQRLSPSFVRVTFGGPALADLGVDGALLDQRIKLVLPAPGSAPPVVDGADLELTFADGEEIRTEVSAKFTRDAVESELHAAGLALDDFFTDGAGLFGLAFASPR